MASVNMQWRIVPTFERTQSAHYMPLICSVIDTFTVQFPDRYEALFNETIQHYKKKRIK